MAIGSGTVAGACEEIRRTCNRRAIELDRTTGASSLCTGPRCCVLTFDENKRPSWEVALEGVDVNQSTTTAARATGGRAPGF